MGGGGLGGWRWGERLGVGGLKRTEWGGQYGEDGTVYVERAAEVAQSIRYLSGMCVCVYPLVTSLTHDWQPPSNTGQSSPTMAPQSSHQPDFLLQSYM